jgi:putative hydrolase of the HAD superfamily
VPVTVEAVIFDWGGTLTPWRTIDPIDEWRALATMAAPDRIEEVAAALCAAATTIWERSRDEHTSSTMAEICQLAKVIVEEAHLQGYRDFWEPATFTDPDVKPLFEGLRERGIRVGVLSNTVWPRAWHEEFFERDGVLHLVDGAIYTSEIAWTKPHPEAFFAAMTAVGATDAGRCVFVGDRLFDDIHGANSVGMRSVLLPHSAIPSTQRGHTDGEPHAVINRLADLLPLVDSWLAKG